MIQERGRFNWKTVVPFIMGLSIVMVSFVKSEPNTSVKTLICNEYSYEEGDPYSDSVSYVVADLMNLTPVKPLYDLYVNSPYPTWTAFGHANCNQSLSNSDCASCLVAAHSTLSGPCLHRIGAQIFMADCFMRYENYVFY